MKDRAEETRERIEQIRLALAGEVDDPQIDRVIGELHPADLAEIIDGLDERAQIALFRRIPSELRAETLSEVDEEAWPGLLEGVGERDVQALFRKLERDDAADILGELSDEDASEILARIEPAESREIAALMRYDEESAGGVMTTDLVRVSARLTADQAIVAVRRQGQEIRDFYTVYVVDEDGHLVGILGLQNLLVAAGDARVESIMNRDIVRVLPGMDQEEVARLFAKYNLISIPVVDEFDRLLGRITVDDVIDIIEAETTEDIFRLSGVDEEEEAFATPVEIFRSRAPWLFITLLTSGLGALVVAQFEATIRQVAFIAVFMPVVAAMAGNTAIQATTVAVRRLALSGGSNRPLRSLPRELAAGFLIGGLISLLLAIAAGAWQGSAAVALVVGGSMWAAMAIGAAWGAAFPLLLDKVGFDPAVSSSVFLTTMTDLISFLLILGSATYFLTRMLA